MGTPPKRPTIRDVAREAGVSHATVSRVLNGGKWVGAESTSAVRRAIARTGYTANQQARSLATGRSQTYAFLLTQPQRALFEDPNYAVLVRAAADALAALDQTMVIIVAGTDADRRRAVEYVGGGHVDGVLLLSPQEGDPLLGALASTHLPIVCNGGAPGWEDRISTVTGDDLRGARLAVEHLVAQGRRRIATIAGPGDSWGGQQRLDSYRAVLAGHGLADATLEEEGDWSEAAGEASMAELLGRVPDLDAVFAANDAMAAGALRALRRAGRRVGDDVAVVGYDDSPHYRGVQPSLTTVHVPLEGISREMVRVVTDQERDGAVRILLPTRLVVRDSAPGASRHLAGAATP